MPVGHTDIAGNIVNTAAVEMGLTPQVDPYASDDASFRQLGFLLTAAGEELTQAYPWEYLVKTHSITTVNDPIAIPPDIDSGDYDLPDDFLYMINQTGWERSNQTPLFGPLSAQDWTYLDARGLGDKTIYASFRIRDGKFSIFPRPPPNGLTITFEYITKNWALDPSVDPPVGIDRPTQSGHIVLHDKLLMSRYLKVKFLEAKGFDSTKARDDFNQQFGFITSKDKAAEILSAGGRRRTFPALDTRSIPDTGYGRAIP